MVTKGRAVIDARLEDLSVIRAPTVSPARVDAYHEVPEDHRIHS